MARDGLPHGCFTTHLAAVYPVSLRSLQAVVAIMGVAAAWYGQWGKLLHLGLKGYCPATLVHEHAWTMGQPKCQFEYEGSLYLFAGPEEQRLFEIASARNAPVCAGDDVVRLADENRRSVGHRVHGLTWLGPHLSLRQRSDAGKVLQQSRSL